MYGVYMDAVPFISLLYWLLLLVPIGKQTYDSKKHVTPTTTSVWEIHLEKFCSMYLDPESESVFEEDDDLWNYFDDDFDDSSRYERGPDWWKEKDDDTYE